MAVLSIPYARLIVAQSTFDQMFSHAVSDATGARIVVVPDAVLERSVTAALVETLKEAGGRQALLTLLAKGK